MFPPTPSEQLHAKRKVAFLAVERLLRVCSKHEHEAWLSHFRELRQALQEERDQDAIEFMQGFERRTALRWVISERLEEEVRRTIGRLRTHIAYDDQRPPLILELTDPEIESDGTKDEQLKRNSAERGIRPGLPVVGLSITEMVSALSLIESAESSIDKRILSIRVQTDGSLLVNTGQEIGPLAGGGNTLVLNRTSGQWVITTQGRWIS